MQKKILALAILLLTSCNDIVNRKQTNQLIDTLNQQSLNSKHQKAINNDSLSLAKILDSSLKYGLQFKNNDFFKHDFETYPDDTSFIVTVQMLYGHLFSQNKKHLLIRQEVPWATYCNVYVLQDDQLKAVLKREQRGMTYVGDTARDVNGDNYNDFIVHWYPSSGCCLAEMYNVYIYQPTRGNFTNDYSFINPTFFPKEKTILGLEYGHPGEAALYKYKWNGLQIDTVEYIYPYYNNPNTFVKTTSQKYRPTKNEGLILNKLPKEYKQIDSNSLKWFFDKY